MAEEAHRPKPVDGPHVVDDAPAADARVEGADARRDRERTRLELRGLRARFVRDVVEVVAFALAAVWAIYTFWYQQHWLPRQVPPMVVVSVDLTATGERDGLLALTAHVKLRNPGTSRVRMLAQNLVLVGAHVRATADRSLAERVPDGAGAWLVARGTDVAASEALASAAQSFLPPTSATLEPGEEVAHDYVFYVAPGNYDLVRLQTSVLYTRTGTRVRPEWIAKRVGSDGRVQFAFTAACRLPDCTGTGTDGESDLSLWPAPKK